jgi:hypothetical protein
VQPVQPAQKVILGNPDNPGQVEQSVLLVQPDQLVHKDFLDHLEHKDNQVQLVHKDFLDHLEHKDNQVQLARKGRLVQPDHIHLILTHSSIHWQSVELLYQPHKVKYELLIISLHIIQTCD